MNLKTIFEDDNFQLTGIAVSKRGRLFVNYPRWSDAYLNAVVEVLPDGTVKPFPDEAWNRWDLKPSSAGDAFVCVQSVVVDASDALWILDPAGPLTGPVVSGGPKLVRVDLATNEVTRVIRFDDDVATPDSYLNDVRFDADGTFAYLTESGRGALIVVDLRDGSSRRLLDGHPSVKIEEGLDVVVGGKKLLRNGKPPQFQADGIALSPGGDYLYYKPVTAKALYRIPTAALRDAALGTEALGAAVERVAELFPTDGLWMTADGDLYLSDVEHDAVSRFTRTGTVERVVEDRRLQWPDTFTEGPDGTLYISASHINESANYNVGKSVREKPYGVYAFRP